MDRTRLSFFVGNPFDRSTQWRFPCSLNNQSSRGGNCSDYIITWLLLYRSFQDNVHVEPLPVMGSIVPMGLSSRQIFPFRITVFRPNLYISQMIENGSNIMAHYNLESRTIIWRKSNISSNLKTDAFYLLRFSINIMAATIAMIKNVCQMGIVYMFEESEIFLLNICGNEVHRWFFTD